MSDLYYRKDQHGFHLRALVRRLAGSRRAVVSIVLGFPLLLYIIFGSHGVIQRIRLQNQRTELKEKVRQAEEETGSLRGELKGLEGDKKTIEKVARERYGMHREGETVYKVKQKK